MSVGSSISMDLPYTADSYRFLMQSHIQPGQPQLTSTKSSPPTPRHDPNFSVPTTSADMPPPTLILSMLENLFGELISLVMNSNGSTSKHVLHSIRPTTLVARSLKVAEAYNLRKLGGAASIQLAGSDLSTELVALGARMTLVDASTSVFIAQPEDVDTRMLKLWFPAQNEQPEFGPHGAYLLSTLSFVDYPLLGSWLEVRAT
ncbi:hypothetical protein T440DRAFT_518476 [Plenodomus tracheiphilus IPT5]|uniref:Uncharacterized protein n=1 Tax=Plenodomus tracheiphilus IPT5 TaxID=1408161 RepID=A0A6A7B7L4_9PLEO|nr:hypothetical protein T440DRAFT_518476 [Plenodomus tracheiphilus IPT5]